MLRDGIEDYEYLTMLEKLLVQKKERLSTKQYAEYEKLLSIPETITKSLTKFTTDPATIQKHRHSIAQAIEQLGNL